MKPDLPARSSLLSRAYRSRGLWALCLLSIGVTIFVFLKIGDFLVKEDPVEKSQAVLVLSGGLPVRAQEAAKLVAEGYAQEVWLTHPAEPQGSMETLGIPYESEESYSRKVLWREGVPPEAIAVLPTPILNTADELHALDLRLAGSSDKTVIVVTSKAHTRRVHALWERLSSGRNRIIVRAASGDSFDPDHWWRTTHGALEVVREVLGLLNTWAGLPLRPSG